MTNCLKNLLGFLTIGCLSFALHAATPSPAMMAQFNKLPKSEQAKIARQYGFKLSDFKKDTTGDASLNEEINTSALSVAKPEQTTDDELVKDESEKGAIRFGLSFFEKSRVDVDYSTGIPVPSNYRIGPDDELKLQVFGSKPIDEELIVSRDGSVSISDVGVVAVAGLTFSEAKQIITKRIQAASVGADVNLSMGQLRTINVMVTGEAKHPGSYSVPALSSVVDVLVHAGGVSEIGALRRVKVKQQDGQVIAIDLYQLLLGGDSSVDRQLQNGDVVFVAPYGALAEVAGEALRPALYEIENGETVNDLVKMAGGGKAEAYLGTVTLERIENNATRKLINLDLAGNTDLQRLVLNGDVIRFGKVSINIKNKIEIIGAVARPGFYAHRDSIKVSDLLSSIWTDLTMNTDLDYALVVSRVGGTNQIIVKQFNLGKAIENPGEANDLILHPQDSIYVFSYDSPILRDEVDKFLFERYQKSLKTTAELVEISEDFVVPKSELLEEQIQSVVSTTNFTSIAFGLVRDEIERASNEKSLLIESIQPKRQVELLQEIPRSHHKLVSSLMRELLTDAHSDPAVLKLTAGLTREELLFNLLQRLKTSSSGISNHSVVYVSGEVKYPGEYPKPENGTVQDLIAAAGGLLPSAFLERGELTRANINNTGAVQIEHVDVQLFEEINNRQKTSLQSRDRLNVFRFTDWNLEQRITIAGQVRFPGEYSVRSGETLADVLKRAGGLTRNAFPQGAVMIREQVKAQEIEQITKLTQQLRRDIAARTLSAESSTLNTQDALLMLTEIEKVKPVGRLVVDVEAVVNGSSEDDLVLENGDYLMIPTRKTTVSIVGEVQHPSSHRFKSGLTLDDYLRLAGGSRKRADEDRIYIIRADGSVLVPQNNSWFAVSSDQDIQPGDTVVVPLDTEFKDNMTLWTQVTQIFYQSAVAFAAINSF
ncbi:MAG: SLBB domain-containing protein [Gammaproteobacteria bacterium]|nr:SLBB domain-containing protein [Gammaproteobacteria bacterium]